MKKVSLIDKFYASFLMAFTKEYSELESFRVNNNYNNKIPTIANPVKIKTQYAKINGVKVRYAHYPNEGKDTLVMLSPLPQSILAYAPIWEKVTNEFEVYAYDLPGFGRSEGGMEFMTFKAQGEFLYNFINAFDIRQPHIMAPDIGMPTALYYAGTFKNDIQSLMIGDGPAIAPSTNGSIIDKLGFSKIWQFLIGNFVGSGAFVEVGNRLGYLNYVPNETELSDYIQSYEGRLKLPIAWFKFYNESIATVDPLIDTIDIPTLIFWGGNDQILPFDNGVRIHERMKDSQLHIFQNCGHFAYQDQHEKFSEMMVNWVNNHKNKTRIGA
ncbi:alpha/beta fold hydrolase [Flammeovirga pacifica]|uniref:AB hydrolase-1 domain-containing protein n=1 Tax=Flammeovirga pacifica TaxID=915059 RepID=A0A1S1YT35_FLAPC|nr:alpha/beta hydrolase [Flammeovirga pacifica]OHX64187.1 hypothetical protein NH26_21520 [Flammeovirga pacifica]